MTKKDILDDNFFVYMFFFFLIFICWIFRPAISTPDAMGMATQVAQGGKELFQHHHLLYNVWVSWFYQIIQFVGLNLAVLETGILLNAILSGFVFLIIYWIFKKREVPFPRQLAALICSTWSILRFGAENETYIIPLFFALGSMLLFILFEEKKQKIFLWSSCLLLSLAVLTHQTYILWFLAFLFWILYTKRRNLLLPIFLIGSIIPLFYIYVQWAIYNEIPGFNSTFNFVTHDYQTGAAGLNPGYGIFMAPIGLMRAVVQIHGIQWVYIKNYLWMCLIPLSCLGATFFIIIFNQKYIQNINTPHNFGYARWVFFMMGGFAFYSSGNPEFMVMLPCLFVLSWATWIKKFPIHVLKYSWIILMCWNFSLGLFPFHLSDNEGIDVLSKKVELQNPHLFVLRNYHWVHQYAQMQNFNTSNHRPAPGLMNKQPLRMFALKREVDSALLEGKLVYTDILNEPVFLNKAALVQTNIDHQWVKDFHKTIVDSFPVLQGYHYIWRLNM